MIGPWKDAARLREELREARSEVRRLTDVIVSMKREGFTAAAPVAYSETTDEDLIDELDAQIRDAIRQESDDDSPEAAELEVYARAQLAAGFAASEIAHTILDGLDVVAFLD